MSARTAPVTAWTSAQRVVAQPGGLLMTAVIDAMVVTVLAGVWRAAAGANGGTIAGYSAAAVTWYIATSEAGTISMNSRLIDDIGTDIASGAITVELLRPVSVLRQRLLVEFGRVLPRLAVCIATGFIVARLTGGRLPSGWAALLAIPSLVLAVACNIVAQHVFAAGSFWLRESRAMWFLYQKLVFMLGGMLIPLEVFPSWLRTMAVMTPFPSMAYTPARLASGHFEPGLLGVQVAWLAVLGGVAAFVFGRGERRLQVIGG